MGKVDEMRGKVGGKGGSSHFTFTSATLYIVFTGLFSFLDKGSPLYVS